MTTSQTISALVASNRGRVVAGVAALVTGGLAQLATSKGFQLPGELATSIAMTCAALAGWAIDHIAARINNASISQIQEALPGIVATGGAQPDGKTVQAVQQLVASTDPMPSMPSAPDGNPIPTERELNQMRAYLTSILTNDPKALSAMRAGLAGVDPAGK